MQQSQKKHKMHELIMINEILSQEMFQVLHLNEFQFIIAIAG